MRKSIQVMLFLCLLGSNLLAQRNITGKVTNEAGEVLIGATVLVAETSIGTVTDIDGTYQLEVPDETTHLIFSYTGYRTEKWGLWNKSQLDAVLSESTALLEEVVVIGYSSVKRKELTGAVSSVKIQEIENVQLPSLETALQGRAAGVQVTKILESLVEELMSVFEVKRLFLLVINPFTSLTESLSLRGIPY